MKKTVIGVLLTSAAAFAAISAFVVPDAMPDVMASSFEARAATSLPASTVDVPATGSEQTAVLAGGCFWTMEAVFSHIAGVKSVVSGFAGGTAETAHYDEVGTGKTGHAEAVRITFDPKQITYGELLQIYFGVAHDPTQINRQGPDTGRDYRSAIFPQTARQREVAQKYIAQLEKSDEFSEPIATKVETGQFFPAEAYHQNFVERNPQNSYVQAYDVEKLRAVQQTFPKKWKEQPAA